MYLYQKTYIGKCLIPLSFFHRNSVYTLEDRGVFYPCPSVLEIEPVWKQKRRRNSVFPSLSLMRFLSLRFFKPLQIRSEKIEFGNQFLLYGCTHTHARTHTSSIPIARCMRGPSIEKSPSLQSIEKHFLFVLGKGSQRYASTLCGK